MSELADSLFYKFESALRKSNYCIPYRVVVNHILAFGTVRIFPFRGYYALSSSSAERTWADDDKDAPPFELVWSIGCSRRDLLKCRQLRVAQKCCRPNIGFSEALMVKTFFGYFRTDRMRHPFTLFRNIALCSAKVFPLVLRLVPLIKPRSVTIVSWDNLDPEVQSAVYTLLHKYGVSRYGFIRPKAVVDYSFRLGETPSAHVFRRATTLAWFPLIEEALRSAFVKLQRISCITLLDLDDKSGVVHWQANWRTLGKMTVVIERSTLPTSVHCGIVTPLLKSIQHYNIHLVNLIGVDVTKDLVRELDYFKSIRRLRVKNGSVHGDVFRLELGRLAIADTGLLIPTVHSINIDNVPAAKTVVFQGGKSTLADLLKKYYTFVDGTRKRKSKVYRLKKSE